MPHLWPTESGTDLDKVATKLDDKRYRDGKENVNVNPFLPAWKNVEQIWKMIAIQEIRLIAFQGMRTMRKAASISGIQEYENFVQYGRNHLLKYQSEFTSLSKACPLIATSKMLADKLRRDPYYVPYEHRFTKKTVRDVEHVEEQMSIWTPKLKLSKFKQWNNQKHFGENGCLACLDQVVNPDTHKEQCAMRTGLYGDGKISCEYPLCEKTSDHTILTCNMVTVWCQVCERRGHLPIHHTKYDQIQLETWYLNFEPYNLMTGFKLLTAGQEYKDKVEPLHWRMGLYGNTLEELPKYLNMQLPKEPKPENADLTIDQLPLEISKLNKKVNTLENRLRKNISRTGNQLVPHQAEKLRAELAARSHDLGVLKERLNEARPYAKVTSESSDTVYRNFKYTATRTEEVSATERLKLRKASQASLSSGTMIASDSTGKRTVIETQTGEQYEATTHRSRNSSYTSAASSVTSAPKVRPSTPEGFEKVNVDGRIFYQPIPVVPELEQLKLVPDPEREARTLLDTDVEFTSVTDWADRNGTTTERIQTVRTDSAQSAMLVDTSDKSAEPMDVDLVSSNEPSSSLPPETSKGSMASSELEIGANVETSDQQSEVDEQLGIQPGEQYPKSMGSPEREKWQAKCFRLTTKMLPLLPKHLLAWTSRALLVRVFLLLV